MANDSGEETPRKDGSGQASDPEEAQPSQFRSSLKFVLVFAALGVAMLFLVFGTGASDALTYSKEVSEVMVAPDRFVGRPLRVEGLLEEGSIEFDADPCEHRFVLSADDQRMRVRYPRCVVPDTFRDDMGATAVVEGRLQPDHTFLADNVVAKCPSKYDEANAGPGVAPDLAPAG